MATNDQRKRYSRFPEDPGHANWREDLRVWVDGKEVLGVYMADEFEGVVVAAADPPRFESNGEPSKRKLRGLVKVKATGRD